LGRAARARQPQVEAHGPSGDDALAQWAREHQLPFLAAYPLTEESKAYGALLLASASTPSEPLQALFRFSSRLASMVLHNADLFSSAQETLNKLRFLVEASKALNSTLDLGELLGRILDVAKTQTGAERGTLFLVDEKTEEIWSLIAHGLEKQEIRLPIGRGIAGHVARTGEIVNIPDAYADPRFDPEVDKRTGFRTRNILCLPIRNKAGKIIAALQLLNKTAGSFNQEDSDFLMTLSGHMALGLENAQLHGALLEKERLEKEMALARGIQRSLLPETAPVVQGFEIALMNEPCYAVGGDYYDFLNMGPHTLLVVIADVEGKGISSAMVMSNLQATLRALVLHIHSLNDIVESVNRMILEDTRGEKYMTMFLGLIDTKRKSIHYINCGHVPPFVLRPSQQEPIELNEGGMVVGLFEGVQYDRGHTKLQPGDVIVLCTDGITESMDAEQNEYGSERLAASVRQHAGRPASEIVDAASADVARYSREGTHLDDKVMIAIKLL
jgi:sigma-B regulation protein RsbU (phosphoserine phosphatase)